MEATKIEQVLQTEIKIKEDNDLKRVLFDPKLINSLLKEMINNEFYIHKIDLRTIYLETLTKTEKNKRIYSGDLFDTFLDVLYERYEKLMEKKIELIEKITLKQQKNNEKLFFKRLKDILTENIYTPFNKETEKEIKKYRIQINKENELEEKIEDIHIF